MDFKKILYCSFLLLLFSSCDWLGEDLGNYDASWFLINKSDKCIMIKKWHNGESFFYSSYADTPFFKLEKNEKTRILLLGGTKEITFSNLLTINSTVTGVDCDSITFESCDGSEVYYVWHTTGVDNGEPLYQEENWRYESKDNGYTNCWYYTLTPEFVLE